MRRIGGGILACVFATMLVVAGVSTPASPLGADPAVWKPISAPAPAWYTPELHARVLAAGPSGVPLPDEAAIPVSSLAFLGIRPGALLIINGGTLCSSNFVFQSGTQRYIGTAGHCGDVGSQVTMVFLPLGLADIGTIVQSTGENSDLGNDFALISIDPALNQYVSPSMAHWGGPTGVYRASGPAPILHSGWGLGAGTGGTPRAGLGVQWTPNEWIFESVITPGDSGSGAIVAGGLAAGNITSIHVNSGRFPFAFMGGTSMERIMQMVGGLELATCAPIPWPLPGCPPL